MTGVFWDEWTSSGLTDVAARTTLLLPIGATEQHGPHLPVGVDAMVASHLAENVARAVTTQSHPVLVAPVLAFGSSHHHLPRAGTLSLSSATMLHAVTDVLCSAARTGVRRLLVVNGHGGNSDIAGEAVREVALHYPVVAAAVSYWAIAGDDLIELAQRHRVDPVPGHAGAFETSLLLALRPHLVDRAAVRPRTPFPESDALVAGTGVTVARHGWVDSVDGCTDGASTATEDAGRDILDLLVERLSQIVAALARETPPERSAGHSGPHLDFDQE